MKVLTASVLAVTVVGALGSIALGQGEGADNQLNSFQMLDSVAVVVTPTGRVIKREISDQATTDMILKAATPMAANTILFMHDKHIYMTRDTRGPNGKMLSHMIMHGPK